MIAINANQYVLCQPTLWYLEKKPNVPFLKYNPATIQSFSYGNGDRIGGPTFGIDQLRSPEGLPLYETINAPQPFSGLLVYVGRGYSTFGYKGSNTTGDGSVAIFYDINQNFICSKAPPPVNEASTPDNETDSPRYYASGEFPIDDRVHFILIGGYHDTFFEIEEIKLK